MNSERKKELNEEAKKIFENENIEWNPNDNYDALVKNGFVGFADLYLEKTWNKTKLVNDGKFKIYEQLMKIDEKLGSKDEKQLWMCCYYSADVNVIKLFDQKNIDFKYKDDDGFTIFGIIFEQASRHEIKGRNMTGVEWTNLIRRTEEVFFHLTKKAENKMGGEELKNILEMTSSSGGSSITPASMYSSKILDYLVDKEVNFKDDYDALLKNGYAGYAHHYIEKTWNETKLVNDGKFEVYKQLMKIDENLGTKDEKQLWKCCWYSADLNVIKLFHQKKIDFKYTNKNGVTIFISIFTQAIRHENKGGNMTGVEWTNLIGRSENVFFHLIEKAEKEINEKELKNILEMTNSSGSALIMTASGYSSKIFDYLVDKKVKLNNVNSLFQTPSFELKEVTEKLLDGGVNPKIIQYNGYSELYHRKPSPFVEKRLKQKAEKFENAIYVAVKDQKCKKQCPTDCRSKMDKFYSIDGIYLKRTTSNQVGKGGFGTVFRGEWHGEKVVFKFIQMAKIKHMVNVQDAFADLENRLEEISKVPDGKNILKPLGHFRQQEQTLDPNTGCYVADNYKVFVFPECRMDLEKFRRDVYKPAEDTNCQLLIYIMQQCANSVKTLNEANICHNDLKPTNFVVKWPEGKKPTVSNLEVFLTDFGMPDKLGGTPVYASPEILTNPTPGVSDLYSLGRVFTFLCCENSWLFFNLIFFGIKDKAHLDIVETTMESIPIMNLILKMTEVYQKKRIKINQVKQILTSIQNVEIISKTFLISKGFPASIFDLYDNDPYTDHQVTQMLKESKFSFEAVGIATATMNQNPANFLLNSQISKNIHNQGDSSLCWAYSSSTMIRRALVKFFKDNQASLTSQEETEIENFVTSNEFHFYLRNQIVMNPIPKRIKKQENATQRNQHEANFIQSCLIRLIHGTALDNLGILHLERVQEFFKKMKIPLDQVKSKPISSQDQVKVEVDGEYFNLKTENGQTSFYNHVTQSKLCPVVMAMMKSGPPCSQCSRSLRLRFKAQVPNPDCPAFGGQCPEYACHAMVIDSVLPGQPVRYQCKNTYPSNEKILVSSNWDSVKNVPYQDNRPLEYICNAISIQFFK